MNRTISFVTELNANDVLFGRGAPAILNDGNRRFRALVATHKSNYMSTAKRAKKDQIARTIMDMVIQRGGRFLRRVDSLMEAESLGISTGSTAWVLVDENSIIQKIKQTLRDREEGEEKEESLPTQAHVSQGMNVDAFQQLQNNASMAQFQMMQQQQQQNQSSPFFPGIPLNMQSLFSSLDLQPFLLPPNGFNQLPVHQNISNEVLLQPGTSNLLNQTLNLSERQLPSPPRRVNRASSLDKSSRTSSECTSGEEAIRLSMKGNISAASNEDTLGLTVTEAFILLTACCKGLNDEWVTFAQDHFAQAMSWNQTSESSLEALATSLALEKAQKWSLDPASLAKTTICLLERIRLFGGPNHYNDESPEAWFGNEIGERGQVLELQCLNGRPLPLCAQDSLEDQRFSESQAVAHLARSSAAKVFSQCAYLTWIRCVANSENGPNVIRQASGTCFYWDQKPQDWDALDDMQLLRALSKDGYNGLLDAQSSQPKSSYRSRGLSIAALETRISALAIRLFEIKSESRKEQIRSSLQDVTASSASSPSSKRQRLN